MEYLQKATLCLDYNKERQISVLNSDVSSNDRYEAEGAMLERKHRLSRSSRQSIISPVARILKDSAALVNSTVLSIRDGLTEEQRAANMRLEEKRQIVQLRLKNVKLLVQTSACAASQN